LTDKLNRRAVLFLALLICGCSPSFHEGPTSVLLVTVDTLRADHVGCYGGKVPTPHLDRLASEGSIFLDVVAQCPMTLPSHASILTGTTPIYHGIKVNGRYRLHEDIDTLAEMLNRAGYGTAAFIGAMPVHSRFGLNQGFDIYDESFDGERRAAEVVTGARDWIEQQVGKSFFLWVHLFDPHWPYEPPESFSDRYGDTYEGEVAYLDHALGPLFSSTGDNTLIVVTADHGEGLGEHKEDTHSLFIYDSTLRVPLIFRGPGVPRDASFREQARSIDIVPSILDLLGLTGACSACQGRSLVPLMRGEEVKPEASYAETYFPRLNLGWSELRSIRREGWKYIAAPEPELYDLSSDPGELTNLAREEPERVEKLAAELIAIEQNAAGPFDVSPSKPDPQTLRMLRSMGYVSAENTPSGDGPLPDPKSKVDLWRAVRKIKEQSDKGRIDQAIVELKSVLQQDDRMIVAHYHLSECYYRKGQYEATIGQCEKLLAIDPEHSLATLLMGESLFRLGRIGEAEKAYEKAAEIDTLSPDPLVRLANLHLATKNIDKARQALDQAIQRDSRNNLVAYVRGKLALVEGDKREAEKAFRDAIEAAPLKAGVRVHLANLLVDQKRFDEAEWLLRQGVTLRSQDAYLHMSLGRVLAISGQMEQTIQSFETAHGLAPDSPAIMTNLGIAYLRNKEDDRGLALLTRSLELNPDQPQIRDLLRQRRP